MKSLFAPVIVDRKVFSRRADIFFLCHKLHITPNLRGGVAVGVEHEINFKRTSGRYIFQNFSVNKISPAQSLAGLGAALNQKSVFAAV